MEGQALVSIPEVKERVGGLSRSRIYQLIRDGELQRVKIGARAFVTEESLSSFFDRLTDGGAA
jgi:predicted DNA-binding transcriptional regulator AlpA